AAQFPAVALPGVVAKFARRRNSVPTPQPASGRGIVRIEESARAKLAASNANEDLVLHNQRRAGDAVTEHRIGNLHLPQWTGRSGVERDERSVERADEEAVAEHRDTAVERIDLVRILDLLRSRVPPNLAPIPRVERHHHTGLCRVHDAVDNDWRGFENGV